MYAVSGVKYELLHTLSVGPLGVGLVLDLSGGDSVTGWGLAFGHIAVITLMGLFILRKLGRIER